LALGLALELLRGNQDDPQLLSEAQDELQAALHELRQLARGIHPAVLSDNGLAAAVGSLVDRAPLPVSLDVDAGRYPSAVENAAYFVVSEALANITKHAQAHSASVSISRSDGRLLIEVSDDGCGGASPAAGGGLQGLEDRVGALNGSFGMRSDPDAGTTITVELPCGSS
jgi:signal transduction histidine kinase